LITFVTAMSGASDWAAPGMATFARSASMKPRKMGMNGEVMEVIS
jgi:hypothetical protein